MSDQGREQVLYWMQEMPCPYDTGADLTARRRRLQGQANMARAQTPAQDDAYVTEWHCVYAEASLAATRVAAFPEDLFE